MTKLLEPKTVVIDDKDFILSKFDAIGGREIICKYLASGLPKYAEYEENEKVMFKLMNYVAVSVNGNPLRLSTPALINNHTGNWETSLKIEAAMMEYNSSFFPEGSLLTLLESMALKIQELASKMSMVLSELSSPTVRPHSTN